MHYLRHEPVLTDQVEQCLLILRVNYHEYSTINTLEKWFTWVKIFFYFKAVSCLAVNWVLLYTPGVYKISHCIFLLSKIFKKAFCNIHLLKFDNSCDFKKQTQKKSGSYQQQKDLKGVRIKVNMKQNNCKRLLVVEPPGVCYYFDLMLGNIFLK